MPLKNTQLQDACDALLGDIYQQLETLQEKYKTENMVEDLGTDEKGNPLTRTVQRGKYFQLPETHSITPKDNVTTTPDVGDKTPTDQSETYTDFGLVLPAKMPCSISISPYQSPIGWGIELKTKKKNKKKKKKKKKNTKNNNKKINNIKHKNKILGGGGLFRRE